MYLYLYYVYTIPTSHFVIPTPYPIFLRKRISDFRALRKKQVGKQLLVAVGMDSSELDDVLDVALNLTEQCMSLKVACGLGWVGGDDGYLLCCWLDIGWWWLNVVDVGKNIPPKVGLVVFFQVLGDWILIQVNGKFLVFCKKSDVQDSNFVGIRAWTWSSNIQGDVFHQPHWTCGFRQFNYF